MANWTVLYAGSSMPSSCYVRDPGSPCILHNGHGERQVYTWRSWGRGLGSGRAISERGLGITRCFAFRDSFCLD